jgi:concanavalin A-like lectin/glucanase superfamily protein
MPCQPHGSKFLTVLTAALVAAFSCRAGVIATWLFDEQTQVYPSTVLNDCGPNAYVMVLGRGAHLSRGRFGNALEPSEPTPLNMQGSIIRPGGSSATAFGLEPLPIPSGRTVQPMWWQTATFAALLTSGEKHLRSGGFANATDTKLNLGGFDWTVEFWFLPEAGSREGVVFEIGEGPRGENDRVTRLSLLPNRRAFRLYNAAAQIALEIPTNNRALAGNGSWHHLAFVYTSGEHQLRHYVDGKLQPLPRKLALQALTHGDEAYFSVGRDGLFNRPLPGKIDELRFSDNAVYGSQFEPPASFSITYSGKLPKTELKAGPPLLFDESAKSGAAIDLGSRKHLFIDDALVAEHRGIEFVPNPPKRIEKVADEVRGHLSVIEDEDGLIRLYYRGPSDSLAVMTSHDGSHWETPDVGHGEYFGQKNIVLPKPVGLGVVFRDPNAPPESRYKYVSGVYRRGIFVFSSPDGFWFQPHETAALPFNAGSQTAMYYDDQRQMYVAQHRSDYGMTPGGATSRRFILSEITNLFEPWPFEHITPERTRKVGKEMSIQSSKLDPWFLDNGPLTPSGPGIELPTVMAADPTLDPPGTDIYVTDAIKYPWAPDAYVAFPAVYFHYGSDGPKERRILSKPERNRGSGVVETQVAVSREGRHWKRYPRPAYVPIGGDGTNREHMLFVTAGLIRRGNEIWQFVGGHGGSGTAYHSPFSREKPAPLYRYVQRLDGFIAAEASYTGGELKTKPLQFKGNRLLLNIDTGAAGFAQVGLLDERGQPIPGFSVDDCIYINGDFVGTPVEWIAHGTDLASFEGKTVQVVFRMRGAKLYAMQFVQESK